MRVINLFLHTKGVGHRRTGLEIWGGGGHKFASRGFRGHAHQENFEK